MRLVVCLWGCEIEICARQAAAVAAGGVGSSRAGRGQSSVRESCCRMHSSTCNVVTASRLPAAQPQCILSTHSSIHSARLMPRSFQLWSTDS